MIDDNLIKKIKDAINDTDEKIIYRDTIISKKLMRRIEFLNSIRC